MQSHRIETEFLAEAGRLLLEFNESTGEIHRALSATARCLSQEPFELDVYYNGVIVSLGNDGPLLRSVHELRYNAALQARIHEILEKVRCSKLHAETALSELKNAETTAPRHPPWLVVALLGVAAASLACLLGADSGAVIVVGISSAIGLAARQTLARQRFRLMALPFTAALIGAVLGAMAIRLGWTHTPSLALVVPSLMIVPGPHLINGLLDLVDNYLPMCLSRLGLATGILFASAAGIVVGIEFMFEELPAAEKPAAASHLNLVLDMLLAGVVTIGFAAFYNTAWPHAAMATVGGMLGHGARYVALQSNWPLESATLIAGFVVGAASAWIAQKYKAPFAVIAFAGAVTMMPGMHIYRAIGGALQLGRLKNTADVTLIADTLGYATQATFVVIALAIGLIVANRAAALVLNRVVK
jgi:uncharacterized membrane protein YjjP (DUF1212 family)